MVGIRALTAISFFLLAYAASALAQSAPGLPSHPWHSAEERTVEADASNFQAFRFDIDPTRTYSLAELVDLAETHNPETRVAWERARAQAATLGVARSELFPTIAAVALSQTDREEAPLGSQFFRQTVQTFEGSLDLNYTIFDFGA